MKALNFQKYWLQLKLVLRFYKILLPLHLLVDGLCAVAIYKGGIANFQGQFFFKVGMLALAIYITNIQMKKKFFYYQNLGLSPKALFIASGIIDLSIYVCVIYLTIQVL